ncbi:hypothetical protein CRUP_029776 [Coryphaenoides rupestris]|nr:hypothetical protein CRUP_029776 [Coryphaenoides rupestris]
MSETTYSQLADRPPTAVLASRDFAQKQKLKEEREAKRAQLDGRHDYVLSIVASCLGLEKPDVEDAILEGTQIERMERFFVLDGLPHLMFYYQEVEQAERGTAAAPPTAAPTPAPNVSTTGTATATTTGTTTGTTAAAVTAAATPAASIAHAQAAGRSSSGSNRRAKVFVTEGTDVALTGVCVFFTRANTSKAITSENIHRVNLAECEGFDLRTLRGPSDYMAVANSAEAMERIEACLRVWIKQIEQVLAESDQLRKEADDLGPRAELDHWKKRMSRFNYLLDQLKSPDVRAVLGVLIVAKSKLIKSWKELDTRITDSANEAKDNVKYLYTLEKFCDPLYNSDPVTNQMITACKAYITSSGSVTIWTSLRSRWWSDSQPPSTSTSGRLAKILELFATRRPPTRPCRTPRSRGWRP